MLRSDASPPILVYVPPHGRAAFVEILIPVDPDRALLPGDLEELLEAVAARVEMVLDGALVGFPAEVRVDLVAIGHPRHTPVFPVALGGERFEDPTDIEEAIQKLCEGTRLEGRVYDAGGRAFRCSVRVQFHRARHEDRRTSDVWTLDPHAEESADDPGDDVHL